MEETKVVPKALQFMVDEYNRKLAELTDTFTTNIKEASFELMVLMEASPEAGWKLDLDRMVFVRQLPDTTRPYIPPQDLAPTDNASIVK